VADVVKELQGFNVTVHVVDPHADSSELQHEYGFELTATPGNDYNAVIVAVNHEKYASLDESYFKSITAPNALIVDVKGTFRNKIQELNYWSL
jgi:UDP-N-acetyl-D-galactosamine dehydrogenase